MKSIISQSSSKLWKLAIISLFLTSGCATMQAPLPEPSQLTVPTPRADSEGKYLSPYTSDDVVAPWVEKGINAKVGAVAGSLATQKALENIPLASLFARKAGASVGRAAALKLVGGMKFMRASTDLSFDELEDMVIYIYAKHSDHVDYPRVVKLVGDIYPEFSEQQYAIISSASYVND